MTKSLKLIALVLFALPRVLLADDYIKLASWNLNSGDVGPHATDVARHIELINPDVLALQSVHGQGQPPARRTSMLLDKVVQILDAKPGHTWAYRLLPKRNLEDTWHNTAVAWNTERVSLEEEPFAIDVAFATKHTWQRKPYALKFSAGHGKTDILVIPVHMKSNNEGPMLGEEQRQLEAESLVNALDSVKIEFRGEDDIVLIGDTNCTKAFEPALKIFRNAGFRDLNRADQPTCTDEPRALRPDRGDAAPGDRILVPSDQLEFVESSQYTLMPSDKLSHQMLTDHFMVVCIVQVHDDDD